MNKNKSFLSHFVKHISHGTFVSEYWKNQMISSWKVPWMNSRIICGLTRQKKFIVNKKKTEIYKSGWVPWRYFFCKKILIHIGQIEKWQCNFHLPNSICFLTLFLKYYMIFSFQGCHYCGKLEGGNKNIQILKICINSYTDFLFRQFPAYNIVTPAKETLTRSVKKNQQLKDKLLTAVAKLQVFFNSLRLGK